MATRRCRLRRSCSRKLSSAGVAAGLAWTPAGGDILGLVFTVFIILLVTDILGLTKVFPFTRSVR